MSTYMVVYDDTNFVCAVKKHSGLYFRGGYASARTQSVMVQEGPALQEYFVCRNENDPVPINAPYPCLPGGRTGGGETPQEGALREWQEEIGFPIAPPAPTTLEFHHNQYDYYGTYYRVPNAQAVADTANVILGDAEARAAAYITLSGHAVAHTVAPEPPTPQSDEIASAGVYPINNAAVLFGADSWYTTVINSIPQN